MIRKGWRPVAVGGTLVVALAAIAVAVGATLLAALAGTDAATGPAAAARQAVIAATTCTGIDGARQAAGATPWRTQRVASGSQSPAIAAN